MSIAGTKQDRADGMTRRTAACGMAATIALSTSLILTGVRMAEGGPLGLNLVVALCSTILLAIALFSAWNIGRATRATETMDS
jgi:hypothetical protein